MDTLNNDKELLKTLTDKIYTDLDGIEYKFAKLSLDDEDEVNKIIFRKDTVVEVDNKNSKKFLSIVLAPVDSNLKIVTNILDITSKDMVSVSRIDVDTAAEVLADFLLKRTLSGKITTQKITDSMSASLKQ